MDDIDQEMRTMILTMLLSDIKNMLVAGQINETVKKLDNYLKQLKEKGSQK